MNSFVEVISPGNRLTVQDLGRRGSQRFGVSVSGVLDLAAAVTANRLVGNPATSAMLEATFGGLSLSFNSETRVAVTGAEVRVDVNGFQMPLWETMILPAAAVLTLSIPSTGLYSYISVAGGIDTPIVLNSRSTHVASALGGHEGRVLAAGDTLPIGEDIDDQSRPRAGTTAPQSAVSGSYDRERPIRVISAPQYDAFDDDAKSKFFATVFTISNLTDRQGARLDGVPIPAIDGKHDIVSDPAYMGAVQIPSDGKPIVLLADRQPTGGYAKIASVIGPDLPNVVQRTPGSEIAFELVGIEEAQELARGFQKSIYKTPLVEPARISSSHLGVDGKTYNVQIVRPTTIEEAMVANGIIYADIRDHAEVAVTVEAPHE